MVARSGRCYGDPFTGTRGVTQGDLLPPTIFNMMVDAVIFHWDTVVAGEARGPEGFGKAVWNFSALFYVDDGHLSSPMCSAKFCDNLLVEVDIFYHFRGLILCNAKRLQFNRYKKTIT